MHSTSDSHPHTAPAVSVPHPDRGDPRLPHLRNAAGFIEYMETGWATPDRTPDTVPGIAAATAAHRERLSPAFAGRTIVVVGGVAPVRVNDNYYGFRPDSNFFWLSGCSAEDAVLVMSPTAGGHDATLFIPAPAYPGEADFFADAAHGELWVGSAPGMPEWTAARTRNAERIWQTCREYPVVRVPELPADVVHAHYKCYVQVCPDRLAAGWSRDRIVTAIAERGVPCFQGSCSEVYLEKAFDDTGWRPAERLAVARELGETSLMFLVHPTLTEAEIAHTCAAISEVLAEAGK